MRRWKKERKRKNETEDGDYEDVQVAEMQIDVLENPYDVFYDWLDVADGMDGDVLCACEALNLDGENFAIENEDLFYQMQGTLECIGTNVFYLRHVAVNKDYRGCGIGKAMVSSVEDDIRKACGAECGVIVLVANPIEIKRENVEEHAEFSDKLYKFYEDCGFTRIDEQVFIKLF